MFCFKTISKIDTFQVSFPYSKMTNDSFLNAMDLKNSTICIRQQVCSLFHLYCHRTFPKQTAEVHQVCLIFPAMEIS